MGSLQLKDLPLRARIKIPPPVHTGRESVSLKGANLGYAGLPILRNVNVLLERGSHVGVVGHNGAGKSTLLKSLGGQLELITGARQLGYQVSLSYFSQHSAEQLHNDDTVLLALQSAAHKDISAQEILNIAGSLLFAGDDIQKPIRVLSGGEKSRVALGQILLKRSPLLLLDEPTNHLDFDTVEALTEALRAYTGTVVVVSHDRSFIGRIATRILEINHGAVELYPGTYDEYVWSLQNGVLREREDLAAAAEAGKPLAGAAPPSKGAIAHGNSKQLQAQLKELQKQVAKCEQNIERLTQQCLELNAELLRVEPAQAQEMAAKLGQKTQEVETLEDLLLTHMENLELKEKQLAALRA